MKLIITAKIDGKNPTEEEIDETVDVVTKIGNEIGWEWKGHKCMSDGTSLILEK